MLPLQGDSTMSMFHHNQHDIVQTTHPIKTFFLIQLPFIILYIVTLGLVALTEHDVDSMHCSGINSQRLAFSRYWQAGKIIICF